MRPYNNAFESLFLKIEIISSILGNASSSVFIMYFAPAIFVWKKKFQWHFRLLSEALSKSECKNKTN